LKRRIEARWTMLALIVMLLINPEGIAGTGYRKKLAKRRRAAAGVEPSGPARSRQASA
jgi:hypothetical protein